MVATLRVLHDAAASDALARLLTGPRWRIGPRDLVALGRRARDLAAGPGEAGPAGAGEASEVPGEAAADALAEAVTDLPRRTPGRWSRRWTTSATPPGTRRPGTRRLARAGRGDPAAAGARDQAARRPHRRGRASAQPGHRGRGPAGRRPGRRAGRPGRVHRRRRHVRGRSAGSRRSAPSSPTWRPRSRRSSAWRPGGWARSDTVKLLTVHAAKGLQWPAVFVPGLAAGEKSQVFPARPRVSTRWTDNPRLIPFPLRGDAADLPQLRDARRRLAGGVHRGLRRPRPGGGAAARVRRGDPGRVLARLLRLLVGRRDRAARPVGVPHRGPRRVRGRRGNGARLGGRAGRRRGQPAARRGGRGGLAGHPGRPALRGRRRRPAAWCESASRAADAARLAAEVGTPGGGCQPGEYRAVRSRAGAGRRPGSWTPGCCSPSGSGARAAATARWRCCCPPGCRCPRWSRWPGTRTNWPARSAARCRSRPPARPAAAPRSTCGSRSGSASSG